MIVAKLDDFLKITYNEILNHGGKISSMEAKKKAELEYEKYKEKTKNELSEVERHFIDVIDKAESQIKNLKESD